MSPLEAARHLGITPELLTAYCRPGFRRGEDSEVRLATVTVSGRTRFEMSELDRFDAQMRKPWPSRDGARPPIPEAIVAHLRSESRNACARCNGGASVETAHIEPWSTSRSHHPENLIRLCAMCHGSHDRDGLVGTTELRDLKLKLISATRERLARMIDPERGRLPPPRPSRSFFGRGRELQQVTDALRCGSSVLIIGTGGIGKSELLATAISNAATEREVLWLDVERHGTTDGLIGALQLALSLEGEPCLRQDVPSRLDALRACIVFDGVERGTEGSFEGIEALVAEIYAGTRDAQFVFTSQCMSYVLPADLCLSLDPLDAGSSLALLESACRLEQVLDASGVQALLEICAGHALTIRIAAALATHFGSATAAARQIRRRGSVALSIPVSDRQDHTTSLRTCLDVAYDALAPSERSVLWLIANAPGGLFAAQFEDDFFEVGESSTGLRDFAGGTSSLARMWRTPNA